MPIYLNREEEIKGKAPLEFYGDGQNLKDWEIQGKTSENLYPILIGEDTWGNNTGASHQNNDGELVVVMGTGNYSGVYSQAGSTINAVHSQLSTGSWSVEIKADSPMNLRLGFEADGVKYIDITNEYQKFTFNNQSFTSDRAFVVYNSSGVVHTVYLRNFMINLGSTALPYEPYGGVGDYDETEQKYRIPVKIEGENLFDANSSSVDGYIDDNGNIRLIPGYQIKTYDYINIIKDTDYTLVFNKIPSVSTIRIAWYDDEYNFIKRNIISAETYVIKSPSNASYCRLSIDVGLTNIRLLEGSYTTDTLPPYEVDLYTDNQLMDGDSISLSSTQINIPTLNTHNILTVPTQVQPSNITLTLPQTEIEITKILGPLISPRYDITDAYFGNLQVFTVWDTYTGPLPTTLYTTDWGLVDYKIYGTADGAGIKTKNLYNYNASGAVSLNLYPSEENGKLLSGQNNVSIIFAVKPDTVYSIYKLSTTRFRWACYAAAPQEGDEATSFSSSVSNTNIMLTFVTDSNAAYAVVFIKASSDSIDRDVLLRSVVVVEGPYAAQDVPYGYKIPMRSQNSVVDIYIGDTPLGENEYVSYSEQKIYRYINGVLTPTDPPKELPTITTINGNTTIDTTLEEKQYITSDNKVYCVKNGGRYLLKGSGLRPDNFYSKYRKGGT